MMYGTRILNGKICGAVVTVLAMLSGADAANVVARPTVSTANRVSATRPTQAAARMPTMTITPATQTSVSTTPATSSETTNTEVAAPVEQKSEPVETPVTNKALSFGTVLSSKSTLTVDTAALNLAELVRAQRAALDAADAAAVAGTAPTLSTGSGENICDTALRECMIQKCGSNFAKCALDTDTTFGDKLDTCRRTTNCTGHEYQLFATEIKADRDFNAKIANYNTTIDCGSKYDSCIVAECGVTYFKCIGKSTGDDAIRKCESIAKSCTEYDSGLAMRTMSVFGELRQTAERQIATDEQKLYALREQMRNVCTRLGAMFDERSLDCVYTVNFRAGDDATLYASKKLYAGGTFDCTPNWFGIDVTTFRENALRADREQKSASSAMLGSGLGQAAGALTSGAIDRAVARSKADNALEDAIKDCVANGVDEKTGDKMDDAACRAKIGADDGKAKTNANKDRNGNTNAYDPETGKFSITVLDQGGKPIEGCQLIVTDRSTNVAGDCYTDKNGVCEEQYDPKKLTSSATIYLYAYGYEQPTYNLVSIQKTVKLALSMAYRPETKELTGYIVDQNENPIEGVIVGVKDSDNETTTRDTGYYRLKTIKPDMEIEFLHNDYKTKVRC